MLSFAAEKVEASFLVALRALAMPGELRTFLEAEDAEYQTVLDDARESQKLAQDQLQIVRQALARIDRAYFEVGTLSDEEYREKKAEYAARKESLEAEITKPLPGLEPRDFQVLADLVQDLETNWREMEPDERKAFALSSSGAYRFRAILYEDGHVELHPVRRRTEDT